MNIQTIVGIVVVLAIIAFRVYRQTREQRWAIGRIWLMPGIFVAITVVIVALDTTQQVFAPLAAVAGLGLGIAIGMYQGNHTTLRVDKPSGSVFVRVTPIGSAIFLVVLALRIGLRFAFFGGVPAPTANGSVPALPPAEVLLGSGLLALAVGSIIGLRMYVKRAYDTAPA